MNMGISIQDLAERVNHERLGMRDFLAPQGVLKMTEKGCLAGLSNDPAGISIGNICHRQIAAHLGIPKVYYDKMLLSADRSLLAHNVNTWLRDKSDDKRMVRTLHGQARAYLSSKYRPLDNVELLAAVLPVLNPAECKIVSCQVTEAKLYLKVIIESTKTQLKNISWGQASAHSGVVAGCLTISNSETGQGTASVEPGVFEYQCTNLAIFSSRYVRKHHIGRSLLDGDSVQELLSTETRRMADSAFWLTVRDVVKGSLSSEGFRKALEGVEQAHATAIPREAKLDKVVEVFANRYNLPEDGKESVLRNLIDRGDLSQWGLTSAITAFAGEVEDYDTSTQLERAGGLVLEIPSDQFRSICLN